MSTVVGIVCPACSHPRTWVDSVNPDGTCDLRCQKCGWPFAVRPGTKGMPDGQPGGV